MKKIIAIISILAFVGVYSASLFHFHKHSPGETCNSCELVGAACSDKASQDEAIDEAADSESHGCIFCKLLKTYNTSAEITLVKLPGKIHDSFVIPGSFEDFESETVVHLPPRSPPNKLA